MSRLLLAIAAKLVRLRRPLAAAPGVATETRAGAIEAYATERLIAAGLRADAQLTEVALYSRATGATW